MEIESSETVAVDSIEWTDWTDAIGTGAASSIGDRLHAMGVPRKECRAAKEVIDQRLAEVDPPGVIARGLRFYDEWREPPGTRSRTARRIWEDERDDAVRRTIRDVLARRRWEIEDEHIEPCRLTLLTLSGPRADSSSANWKSTKEAGVETGWTLSIAGVGAGRDATVTMSHGVTIACAEGERKMLCVGIELGVRKVACLNASGRRVGTRLSAEVLAQRDGAVSQFEVVSLERTTQPGAVADYEIYDLRDDVSHSVSELVVAAKSARESSSNYSLKAYGVGGSGSVRSTWTTDSELSASLAPGHRYQLLWLTDPTGAEWLLDDQIRDR